MNTSDWSRFESSFCKLRYCTNIPNSIEKLEWEILRKIKVLLYIQERIDRCFLCYDGDINRKSKHFRAINNCHSTADFVSSQQRQNPSYLSFQNIESLIENDWNICQSIANSIQTDYAICSIWWEKIDGSWIYIEHSFIICNAKEWNDLLCFHQYWSGGIYMFSPISEIIEIYLWHIEKNKRFICVKEL